MMNYLPNRSNKTPDVTKLIYFKLLLIYLFLPNVLGLTDNQLPSLGPNNCTHNCNEKPSPPAKETKGNGGWKCLEKIDCTLCDFPPYNFNKFSDAFSILCWNKCAEPSGGNKLTKDNIILSVQSMIKDGSLVSTDIKWKSIDKWDQCLVTWEIDGGGLIGNLLTESNQVKLTLWPDTKYHIQVTCKSQKTNLMRSPSVTLHTSNLTETINSKVHQVTEKIRKYPFKRPLLNTTKSTVNHYQVKENSNLFNDMIKENGKWTGTGRSRVVINYPDVLHLKDGHYSHQPSVALILICTLLLIILVVWTFIFAIRNQNLDDKNPLIEHEQIISKSTLNVSNLV